MNSLQCLIYMIFLFHARYRAALSVLLQVVQVSTY